MRQLSFLSSIALYLLTLLFSLGLSTQCYTQGWSQAFSISAVVDSVRNDIVHIPAYANNKTYPVGLFSGDESRHFARSFIIGENPGAFSSSFNPNGRRSTLNYIPVSSVIPEYDSLVVLSNQHDTTTDKYDLFATLYDRVELGDSLVWHQPVFTDTTYQVKGAAIQKSSDGQLIVLGAIQSETTANGLAYDLFLTKLDLDGNVLWTEHFASAGDDLGVQLELASDGGYYLLKNVQADLSQAEVAVWLMKTDASGQLEWEVNVGNNDIAYDMIAGSDNNLVLTGTNATQDLFVLKMDTNGDQIWRQDYPTPDRDMIGHGLIEDLQNNIVVAGKSIENTGTEINPFIAKLSASGQPLWERYYGRAVNEDAFNDIALTPAGHYLMGGFREIITNGSLFAGLLVKTDTFGILKGGNIQGNVFHDLDLDCINAAGDINLQDWKVFITNDDFTFYGNTDADGNYNIPVDVESGATATYTVSAVAPSSYWEFCNNDVLVTLDYLDTAAVDFAAQALVDCPLLEGQMSSGRLRPCEQTQLHLSYCNIGTVTATDASTVITLDPHLSFLSASIPPSQIDGQTYTFPLGDVNIGECGQLTVDVQVSCDSVMLGDVLCIEADLLPDTICTVPGQAWSGARLELSYTCDEDNIQYQIENVGNATSQRLEYVIIEDAVLLMQAAFTLPEGGLEIPDPLPVNGSTYHLISHQEPGAPGAPWISLGSIGCSNDNPVIITEFPQVTGELSTISYCPTVVGSYDPNDKLANPAGFDEEHYILPNTDINYTIRFQNTGTDTAFRVNLLDTLSSFLDPATILPGPASHPYDYKLYDNGILSFTFPGIALPDSTTNAVASQGFVTFKIKQNKNLSTGTVIENTADIYFDFNPPITTNTTFHTVNEIITILSNSVSVVAPLLQVDVVPNPMHNGAWLEIEGLQVTEPLTIRLFDLNGKQVKQLQSNSERTWLDRSELAAGVYIFTIEGKKGWLANGKIVVQ